MNKIIDKIVTSTAFAVIVLPYLIYVLIQSYKVYRIESVGLRKAINDNAEFYAFLQKTGFVPARFGTMLTAAHEYNVDLSPEETYITARDNVTKFVMAFFESSHLLGLIDVAISIDNSQEFVTIFIKPATYDIFYRNVLETIASLVLWTSVVSAIVWLY